MISHLDHLVLTVRDIPATVDFYTRVLGMQATIFGQGRHALHFGESKINLHQVGEECEPKATAATPGSADLCFMADVALEEVINILEREQVPVEEGPVDRTGALGPLRSVYVRDPDGNLVEISRPLRSG